MNRNVLDQNEGKITVLQIAGFFIMLGGLMIILTASFLPEETPTASVIAVSFFMTMLGLAFAFPSLLKGDEGLSTMRIIVFMMTNVICMLLLKIGWAHGITSLDQIGLDANWVGIIAFIFGAKATQSFFESRMAVPKANGNKGNAFKTNTDIINMAIAQNQNQLYSKGNIRLLSPGKKVNSSGDLIDCVTILLKNNDSSGIPDTLSYQTDAGEKGVIETEIITEVDKPRVSYQSGDAIANSNDLSYKGSIAAKLKLKNKTECLLTCSHVMLTGSSMNFNGYFNNTLPTTINSVQTGLWFYGLRDREFDIALIKDFQPNKFSLPKGTALKKSRELVFDDVKRTKIKMYGRVDYYSPNVVEGYVINHRSLNPITLAYSDGDFEFINLILLSKTIQPPYQALSMPGDSGSLIVDAEDNAVGIVVAQNSQFTYAISFKKILGKLMAEIA